MTKIQVLVLALTLSGCSEAVVMIDSGTPDGGIGTPDAQQADATTPDAGDTGDAGTADSGADSGPADAGSDAARADAGRDAGADAGTTDAGTDLGDAAMGTDAGAADAGTDASAPARPVGAAMDVTGGLCALDSVGSFWCWGRGATPDAVQYLGTGYVDAAGTCARHSDGSVDCADFSAMTMMPIAYGLVGLTVDSIVEYSDFAMGCGVRARSDVGAGWQQAYCWTAGGTVLHLVSTDLTQAMAVSATSPRRALSADLTPSAGDEPDGFDINGTHCMSQHRISDGRAMRTLCGGSSMPRATGDHHILGFQHDCAHGSAQTTCETGGTTPLTLAITGTFHDHAIGYTGAGSAGLVDGEAVYCVSDDALRCYTRDAAGTTFTASYTVAW